jgi:uncharacterized membrane protein
MSKESEEGKVLLILLWLIWPAGLIWYLVDEKMKKNSFVKFHFKQWLMAIIVLFAASFIAGILSVILIGLLLYPVIFVVSLVWLVQGIMFAIKGKEKELWLIGKYAKKHFKF